MSELRFQVTGLDCANCARSVETGVAALDGVSAASLNFTTGALRVEGSVAPERVVTRVRELGYDVEDGGGAGERGGRGASGKWQIAGDEQQAPAADASFPPAPPPPRSSAPLLPYLWARQDTRLALIAGLLVLPGVLFDELLPGLGVSSPLFAGMAVLAMALAGYPIARSAVRALRVNREITINLLMTIAAVGAVIIGAYTEAGLVMVLFALGEALEGYTAARARDTIRGLSALAPAEATVLRDGGEARLPVAALRVGDRIAVRPGERLPMDGCVLAGMSAVNQAPITGESRPVDKAPGDEVFAGSVNGPGALEVEVTHLAEDTTISRMIRLVAEAQERRAPAQRFVDQFARVYTPVVIVVALLVAIIPPLAFDAPFWNPPSADGVSAHGWLYRALALLVVACPCALVISTPVTLISAISNGARHGILFKGGSVLEAFSRVRAMAFDKTGTITRGEPAVVAVRAADCAETGFLGRNPVSTATCAPCDDLLALAAAVERRSEHPLAGAVVAEAAARGVAARYPAGEAVTALAGRGVTGRVNGQTVSVGSHAWFDDGVEHLPHCDDIRAADAQGYTTMLVSAGDHYRGYIALADTPREGSRAALAELARLGVRPLVMLTGDHAATAQCIAAEVGLSDVRAGLLPADKVEAVRALRADHGHVAMVGDGINDTPALAVASVGVALGRAAQALETADVVLLGDDLRQLPFAVRLSRAAMRTVRVNVALSLIIKLVFFVLVLLGSGSMWLAVLADMGTSLLVTANGMRLLRRPKLEE
ncbi:heavy metal translocating P-type ATPase [Promineifilum sp.]|uniref:heavy metal translocating P-type ATPase n=1 Tax=Promineifilum sp. TaxID=2664178 RepID=UPI0035B3D7EF